MFTFNDSFCPRLAAKARLHWDAVEGRYFLLFPEAALALGDTAPAILQLCNGEHTLGEIVSTLATQYGESPGVVEADVAAFVDELQGRGLLV